MGASVINRMTELHQFWGFVKSLRGDREELLSPCNCVHWAPLLSLILAVSSFPVACLLGFSYSGVFYIPESVFYPQNVLYCGLIFGV